jgi:hypothetical protein
MPNGWTLRFRVGTDDETITAVVRAYEAALNAQLRVQRRTFVLWTAAAWFLPCLVVYAFGWAVAWVHRGFKAS